MNISIVLLIWLGLTILLMMFVYSAGKANKLNDIERLEKEMNEKFHESDNE